MQQLLKKKILNNSVYSVIQFLTIYTSAGKVSVQKIGAHFVLLIQLSTERKFPFIDIIVTYLI